MKHLLKKKKKSSVYSETIDEFKVSGRGFLKVAMHVFIQGLSEYRLQDIEKDRPSFHFTIPCEITEEFDSLRV